MSHFTFEVGAEEEGIRLDVATAARFPTLSRATVQAEARAGRVTVDGLPAKPATRLGRGQVVRLSLSAPAGPAPQEIPLRVVYQDRDLAVIDKPPGLVVHPAAGHTDGTLANALAALFPQTREVGERDRPGIVHRLDKDTSGLLVVALSAAAHTDLQAQIAGRSASRRYLALAGGQVSPETGVVEAPIGRDPRDRKRMAAFGLAARPAATEYSVLERFARFTYLEARLRTGRTHQIRVHFAATGHPIAGDSVYGGTPVAGLDRQFLHAWALTLRSPSTGENLEFHSRLPVDLETVLNHLRSESPLPGGNSPS